MTTTETAITRAQTGPTHCEPLSAFGPVGVCHLIVEATRQEDGQAEQCPSYDVVVDYGHEWPEFDRSPLVSLPAGAFIQKEWNAAANGASPRSVSRRRRRTGQELIARVDGPIGKSKSILYM